MLFFLMLVGASVWGQKSEPAPFLTPGGVMDTVYDDLGRKLPLTKLLVNPKTNNIQGRGINVYNTAAQNFVCTAGNFELYFTDGCGFIDNSPNSVAIRDVICKAYTDVSNFITWGQQANVQTDKVRVLIGSFAEFNLGGNTALGVALAYHSAGPLYAPAKPCIVDNQVWKTITSGVDAFTGTTLPLIGATSNQPAILFHMQMALQEKPTLTSNWFTDLAALPPVPANPPIPGQVTPKVYDLYSVVLHEVIHGLGFYSLIDAGGTSVMQRQGRSYLPYYSRFNRNFIAPISATNPTDKILLHSSTASSNLYDWSFNTNYINSNVPIPIPGNNYLPMDCNTALRYDFIQPSFASEPLYNPEAYEEGSSLSHFHNQCNPNGANAPYFTMNAGMLPNIAVRTPTPEERQVLCELGYKIKSSFGTVGTAQALGLNLQHPYNYDAILTCDNEYVAGINDGLALDGSYLYTNIYDPNASNTIEIQGFMANDINTNNVVSNSVEVLIGGGTVSVVQPLNLPSQNGHIRFIPNRTGLHLLRYVPQSATGVEGNITYIYVWVDKNPNDCSQMPCNLVVNGGFETLENADDCGLMRPQYHDNAAECWGALMSTPDLYGATCNSTSSTGYQIGLIGSQGSNPAACTPANTHYVGLSCESGSGFRDEALQTLLLQPLVANEHYTIKLYAKADQAIYGGLPADAQLFFAFSKTTLPPFTAKYFDVNTLPTPVYLPASGQSNITVPITSNWNQYSLDFIAPNTTDLRNLIISTNHAFTTSSFNVLIDNVQLHKQNNDIAPINACLMLGNNLDLTALTNVLSPETISFSTLNTNDITIDAAGNSIFTANSIGTHTINYTYTNTNGCIVPNSFNIEVSNPNPTITVVGSCTLLGRTLTVSGGVSYLWSAAAYSSIYSPSIQTVSNVSIYTVTVTLCDGSTMTASVTIAVGSPLAISGNTCISPQPSGSTLLTVVPPTNGAYTYLWNSNANNATTQDITVTTEGRYSVTVTETSSGCTATTEVLVGQTPTIQSLTSNGTVLLAGQSITLLATVLPTPNLFFYWFKNGLLTTSGTTLSSLTVTDPGTYTVVVSNGLDAVCSTSASIVIAENTTCTLPSGVTTIGSNTNYPTINSAVAAQLLTPTIMQGGSLVIDGDLEIDNPYTFEGVDISFGPAASIIVVKNLDIIDRTNLHGVGCLWDGIKIQTGGSLRVKFCTITDAYRAINISTNASIHISGTIFDRNYTSIYANDVFNLVNFNTNTFDCSAPLALPYPAIAATVGAWSYTGVDLQNAGFVNLGIDADYYHPGISASIFQNLNTGIIANGTTYLDVQEARFINIAKRYTNAYDGAGIVALANAEVYHEGSAILARSVLVDSVFNAMTPYQEYKNCDYGMYADNAQIISRYNTFEDCGVSVYAQNATADNAVAVQWGKIQNTNRGEYGIWFSQCDQAESLEVDGNDIEMSSTLPASDVIAGILINGTNTGLSIKPHITNNLIKQGNAENGIVISSVANVYIDGNSVETKNAVCRNGINIENAEAPMLKCNTVTGNGASQQNYPNTNIYEPVGIKVVASPNGVYQSNYTGDLWTGMYFNIDCSTTDLKQNIFASSHTGLNMGRNLVMDSQNDKGNIFLGDNTNSQFVFAGVNEGNPPTIFNAPMQGAILTNLTTPTVGTWVGQGHYWGANAGAVSQPFAPTARWFVNSAAPQAHDANCSIATPGLPIGTNPNDVAIAQDELAIADYPEEMKKWSVRNLYEKLKENPGLVLPFSVLANFKDSLENTVYNDLYEQIKLQQTAVKMSPTLKTTLAPKRLNIQNIIANLRLTDSLAVADSTQTDSLHLVQRKLQLIQLKAEQTDYATVKQAYYNERDNKLNLAKQTNTLIAATELHTQNEKVVNEVYLNTVAKGNFAYTRSQKDVLSDVANQCPITGGKAVYLARSLYKNIGHISYNDIALCAVQGVSFRTQKPKEVLKSAPDLGIKVYPNPAQSYTTLFRKMQAEEDASIQVIDVLGRPVYSTVWYKNQSEINLNTTDFAAGIYTIKVSNGFTAKLSIIK
jgi:Secretion system C-terminal sorting domain